MQFFKSLFLAASVIGLTSAIPTSEEISSILKYEHSGKVATTSTHLKGQNVTINGFKAYISYPKKRKTDVAILYLSDIFGLGIINAYQLVDKLADAGYFVVAPDLFEGDPVPENALADPSYNIGLWFARHPLTRIDQIIDATISGIKGDKYKVKKLGAVGYCFGGRYVARYLAPEKNSVLDAGFTAHPSQTTLQEWAAVRKPISNAYGELDATMNSTQRAAAEAAFVASNVTFQTSLYSNAEHGFAVRTNLSDPEKRFAQESAYVQAVRFFDFWIKGLY